MKTRPLLSSMVCLPADTFFVGSTARQEAGPDGGKGPNGVDMSHRGGPEGFVKVGSNGKELRWADFNSFYMSLGNVTSTSAVPLLFCDYISGAAVSIMALTLSNCLCLLTAFRGVGTGTRGSCMLCRVQWDVS